MQNIYDTDYLFECYIVPSGFRRVLLTDLPEELQVLQTPCIINHNQLT